MKALVLSGGGAGGAFQVGVLKNIWPSIKDEVGAIYGTSVGALNGAALHYQGLENLETIWRSIKGTSSVLEKNYLFYLGLSHGKYKTGPLKNLIKSIYTITPAHPAIEVKVSVVDYVTGDIYYRSQRASNFLDSVLASASVPLDMEPVGTLVDGGVRDHTPIWQAIRDGYQKITVICCNPLGRSMQDRNFTPKWPYPISIGLRCVDILQNELLYNDIKEAQGQADIDFYAPTVRIIDTFDYDPKKILLAIEQGYHTSNCKL